MSLPNIGMLVIVLHDIHGITPFIKDTCERIQSTGADVLCPDLYTLVNPFAYNRGDNPHTFFLNNIGFEQPKVRILELIHPLRSQYQHIVVLGFSVGATIAWRCSSESLIDGVVGYYGSRIRNYMHTQPKCPVLLLFALNKPAFEPLTIQKPLEAMSEHIETRWYDAAHGFANSAGDSYCPESADAAWEEVMFFLKKIKNREVSLPTNSVIATCST